MPTRFMCDRATRPIASVRRRRAKAICRSNGSIEVAKKAGAECVHPGYGFLSENADFVDACNRAGIVFVGPPAAAIRAMGLKDRAKTLMEKAGVPVVPGYHGDRQDAKFLKEKAYEIGYPVLIKPAAGGGGRGLRRVDKHAEFEAALEGAVREAQSAFGSSRVLIEKYVAAPRHIEIQVFADSHGNVIHLGERDCSLQRRHQKVIEEAPAPGMTPELRAQMGAAAVEAARAVGYVGAGTVEFIADGTKGLRADAFWFIEMNTRLQVEHPVTEAVTGARSRRMAIPRRCGRKAAARAVASPLRRPRHRGAPLCRGSRKRLLAVDRPDRGAGIAGRHPCRFAVSRPAAR